MRKFALLTVLSIVISSSAFLGGDFGDEMPDMEALGDMMGGYGMDGMDPYAGGYGGYGGYGGGYGGYGGEPEVPPPPPREVGSQDEILAFIGESGTEAAVIGYFNSDDDLEIFQEVAAKLGRSYRFAYTTSRTAFAELKLTSSTIYVYKPYSFTNTKYEKIRARYPSATLKASSLEKFIADKSAPLVGEKQSTVLIDDPEVVLFMEINHDKNEKQIAYYMNRMRKVANEFSKSHKLRFNIADKYEFSQLLSKFNFNSKDKVSVGIVGDAYHYYAMETEFSVENLKSFVQDFVDGNLIGKEVHASSSAATSAATSEHIVTLTESTFASTLSDASSNVMIEFYAPWCSHCKALAPEYSRAADTLHEEGVDVILAQYDADANPIPSGFDVQGFPTVMYVPKSTGVPIVYEGARTSAAIVEFVKKQITK